MEQIEITDKQHLSLIWMWTGANKVANDARNAADKSKVVGMAITADLVEAKAATAGALMKLKNVILAMRNGLDPDKEALILKTSNDGRAFLSAEPFDLVEQAGDSQ